MTELQVETTLAFVLCIVATSLVTHAVIYHSKAPKSYLFWSAAACLASGESLFLPSSSSSSALDTLNYLLLLLFIFL